MYFQSYPNRLWQIPDHFSNYYSLSIPLHVAEKLKLELSQRHMAEMDQLSRAHKTQMVAAKMELERAVELKQQKVREFAQLVGNGVKVLTHMKMCLCSSGSLFFEKSFNMVPIFCTKIPRYGPFPPPHHVKPKILKTEYLLLPTYPQEMGEDFKHSAPPSQTNFLFGRLQKSSKGD